MMSSPTTTGCYRLQQDANDPNFMIIVLRKIVRDHCRYVETAADALHYLTTTTTEESDKQRCELLEFVMPNDDDDCRRYRLRCGGDNNDILTLHCDASSTHKALWRLRVHKDDFVPITEEITTTTHEVAKQQQQQMTTTKSTMASLRASMSSITVKTTTTEDDKHKEAAKHVIRFLSGETETEQEEKKTDDDDDDDRAHMIIAQLARDVSIRDAQRLLGNDIYASVGDHRLVPFHEFLAVANYLPTDMQPHAFTEEGAVLSPKHALAVHLHQRCITRASSSSLLPTTDDDDKYHHLHVNRETNEFATTMAPEGSNTRLPEGHRSVVAVVRNQEKKKKKSLPDTIEEATSVEHALLPPCAMQAIGVLRRKGHLKYGARLFLGGLLLDIGFSEEQISDFFVKHSKADGGGGAQRRRRLDSLVRRSQNTRLHATRDGMNGFTPSCDYLVARGVDEPLEGQRLGCPFKHVVDTRHLLTQVLGTDMQLLPDIEECVRVASAQDAKEACCRTFALVFHGSAAIVTDDNNNNNEEGEKKQPSLTVHNLEAPTSWVYQAMNF